MVRWQKDYGYISSNRLNPIRWAPLAGALLHFKYFQYFGDRVQEAVRCGSYYVGSAESKRYAELLADNPMLSLAYIGSVTYRNSEQLIQLGPLKTSPAWKDS